MKKKPFSKSRRNFLANSGRSALLMGAFDTILASLVSAPLHKAWALGSGGFKNFVHLNFYGSPPRWMYDLILNPTNNENLFMANHQVRNVYAAGTGVNSNRYVGGAPYKVVESPYKHADADAKGIHVPYLLSLEIPKHGGGKRKAWDMMQNMIQIRGVDIMNQGHHGASHFHQAAVVGYQTISAVTADNSIQSSSKPVLNAIRAISLNAAPSSIFQSTKGYPNFRFDVRASGNSLEAMFKSLQPLSQVITTGQFLANKATLDYQIQDALKALKPSSSDYYASLIDSSASAMKILTDEAIETFKKLDTDWDRLFGKYKSLCDSAVSAVYPGINDKPIGNPNKVIGAERLTYQVDLGSFTQNTGPDGVDLRLMTREMKLDKLAAQFAVTEFILTQQISPSVSLVPTGSENLKRQFGTEPEIVTGLKFDQHYVGFMPGILANSLYYLGFTTCLMELIDSLKGVPSGSGNLFDETLIYMASEFNRSPRIDGSGSDHGGKAGHVNLFSGRIPKFKLVGNIYKDSVGHTLTDRYAGTWGVAAPIDPPGSEGEFELNILQLWGSVMRLLGAPALPNAVDKTKLIFDNAGDPTVSAKFSGRATNKVG